MKKSIIRSWRKNGPGNFAKPLILRRISLKRGFGYAALYDGRLTAGTSTMTVYDGGAEVQVATHPDFRRRGLAMSCAAAFVLECQRRKIRPCWDAANQISKKMALALGYEYKGEYVTVHMKAPRWHER